MRTAKKVALLLILSFAFIVMPFSMMAGEDEKVYAADSDEISLSKTSITLAPATYKQLTLNGTSKTVKWTTSNNSVAIVTSAGKVYAKKKGTATITAKIKVDGTWQKYTCKVKVKYQTKTVGDITYKDASGTYSVSGKWYKRNFSGKKYQFTNASGSAIYFKTTGTKKVTIKFAYTTTIQKPKIGYSIDGKSFKYKTVGSSVTLNLGNAKTHYVRIVLDRVNPYEDRWSGNGGIAIKSIKPVTASTGVVTAVKPQNPVVVFYGDSITEGVRTIGNGLDTSGTSVTHTYAWYTAEKLGAIPYIVGYASCGLTETGSFSTAYNIVTYNVNGSKTSSYPSDVGAVVLEFGANDDDCSSSTFKSAYIKLVKAVHKKYSSAKIFCVRPPFSDRNGSTIKAIAKKYSYAYSMITTDLSLSTYDNIHPSTSGSKKIATKLAKTILKYTSTYD